MIGKLLPSLGTSAAALLVLALLSWAGCASAPPNIERKLRFDTTPSANGGEPFYYLVRTSKEGEFLAETYSEAAARIVTEKPDPSVKGVVFAQPGRVQESTIEVEEDGSFAVFALFTTPGEPWKLLVSGPLYGAYVFEAVDGTIALRSSSKELPKEPKKDDKEKRTPDDNNL
jgi:hypothetical protein